MYIGNLNHSYRVESLHPAFKTLFEFVKGQDFNKLPMGKIVIDGDNLFIMNLDIEQGAQESTQPLEMHRKYIDVHILLDGTEKIGWKPIEEISNFTQKYDSDGDCALSDDAPRFFVEMKPGDICIVYPEDPHAPAINDGPIRKLIGKVKL
ncbi:MAG: YhcH/YjgK/YiaL family protein [Muribaculaceae bacterium]|nr:YhcH/YjgK/YiaL family protein [Muribaculaceae bacterium]